VKPVGPSPTEPGEHGGTAAVIAWIEQPAAGEGAQAGGAAAGAGSWGRPADLALPLDDRGLLLAEGVFETVLVEAGRPRLLAEHLGRWRQGAAVLGLAPPPGQERVEELLAQAVTRSGIRSGALRLNWSGGGGGPGSRGLDRPAPGEGPGPERFWLQLTALQPCFDPLHAMVSRWERRNGASRLSRCKTFHYAGQALARREARLAGAEEALLLGGDGQLSCGAAANLLVRLEGRWVTPPLASGCLPGVMRARALAQGWLREESLNPESLERWQGALLLNSLGCRGLLSCEGLALTALEPRRAESLWRSLL